MKVSRVKRNEESEKEMESNNTSEGVAMTRRNEKRRGERITRLSFFYILSSFWLLICSPDDWKFENGK